MEVGVSGWGGGWMCVEYIAPPPPPPSPATAPPSQKVRPRFDGKDKAGAQRWARRQEPKVFANSQVHLFGIQYQTLIDVLDKFFSIFQTECG